MATKLLIGSIVEGFAAIFSAEKIEENMESRNCGILSNQNSIQIAYVY